MPVELKHFLLTGKIDQIYCGMPIAEAREKFGVPRHEKSFHPHFGAMKETRLIYGALGLIFEDGLLGMFGVYVDEDAGEIPAFLQPVGYFPMGGKVQLAEFLEYMKSEGIGFRERKPTEDTIFSHFTEGEVGIGGHRTVLSLVVMCPGSFCWRVHRERKPYPKKTG